MIIVNSSHTYNSVIHGYSHEENFLIGIYNDFDTAINEIYDLIIAQRKTGMLYRYIPHNLQFISCETNSLFTEMKLIKEYEKIEEFEEYFNNM